MLGVRVFATIAIALLVFGCSRDKSSKRAEAEREGKPTPVRLALNWVPEPEFGGFYAARESGAYERAGLDVEILGGGAGVPVVQMVATGKVEFGLAGADDVVLAQARGVDVVAVFATFQTHPQGIMAHASRGLTSLEELFRSGLTLAIEPGIPYASWLRHKYGFDGVKIVPYDGGVARFVTDEGFAQQCYVTSEPIAARQKNAEPKVFLVAESGYDPYGVVVVVRRQLLDEKPALVRSFVTASAQGWRTYLDQPGPTNELMGKLNTAMDAATFAAASEAQRELIENDETRRLGLGVMKRERWETLARQLVEAKVIERAPEVDRLFHPIANEVAAKN